MLIVNDRRLLGDGNLGFVESMEKFCEEHQDFKERTYHLYDHKTLMDKERRLGRTMQSSEFIYKILEMNPTIWVEQQINFPDEWGLYTDVDGKKTYLTSFKKAWMPEWTYTLLDQYELVDSKVHGYYNCLVHLLAWGAVTWEQVVKAFGDPDDQNSYRWQHVTKMFRQEDCCQKIQKNFANKKGLSLS